MVRLSVTAQVSGCGMYCQVGSPSNHTRQPYVRCDLRSTQTAPAVPETESVRRRTWQQGDQYHQGSDCEALSSAPDHGHACGLARRSMTISASRGVQCARKCSMLHACSVHSCRRLDEVMGTCVVRMQI